MRMIIAVLVLLVMPLALADGGIKVQQRPVTQKPFTILSATPKGTYHRIAEDIQRACSNREVHVQTTDGASVNLELLDEEEVIQSGARFALTKQDILAAYMKKHPQSKIQPVMQMYSDEISIVVRRDKNIKSIKDLAGKRVAFGGPGSGSKFTALNIQAIFGLQWMPFEIPPEESVLALLVGDVDAIIVTAGHPVKLFSELSSKMQALIVMLPLPELTQYPQSKLPANTYPWQPYDVETRSIRSVIVAASNVSREEISELQSCISSQRAALRKWGHAKWNDVIFATSRSTPEKLK